MQAPALRAATSTHAHTQTNTHTRRHAGTTVVFGLGLFEERLERRVLEVALALLFFELRHARLQVCRASSAITLPSPGPHDLCLAFAVYHASTDEIKFPRTFFLLVSSPFPFPFAAICFETVGTGCARDGA